MSNTSRIPRQVSHADVDRALKSAVRTTRDMTKAAADAGAAAAREELPGAIRRELPRAIAVIGVVVIVISVLTSIASIAIVLNERTARTAAEAAQQASSQRQQEVVNRASSQLDDINRQLVAQGKATVPLPDAAADSSDAIAKVVLGQILAQLPPTPDAAAVGAAIADKVTANLLGTTRGDVVSAAATYLAANADQLKPTADQVQAAVDARLAQNPPPPGRDGADGGPGPAGPAGRGITTTEPDPDDPCYRIVHFSTAPDTERWGPFCATTTPTAPPPTTDPPPTTESGGLFGG